MTSKIMHRLRESFSGKSGREDQQHEDSSVPRQLDASDEPSAVEASMEQPAAAEAKKPEPRRRSDPVRRSDPRIQVSHFGDRRESHCEDHDVRDAAHVPPSVLAQYLGEPTIEHKYPNDSTTKRHSISHQERHYMWNPESN